MSSSPDNQNPTGISLREAYSAIRTWYQHNIDTPLTVGDTYRQASAGLVRALPQPSAISDLEIIAVFREVIAGRLEWGYQGSDGRYTMGAFARAGLETHGRSYSLTAEEEQSLHTSVLWPFIKR
jgi:hypothetical protein